jgi:amino acid transporter
LLVALTIGFTSSMIAVQTAVTRAIWANARDKALPGSKLLGKLSGRENLPRYAIGLTAVIAGILLFFGTSKIFGLLIDFSAFGFYLSYFMPVLALAYVRYRGRWTYGEAWGDRWMGPVTILAVIWLTAEIINLAWPRDVFDSWYLNWGIIVSTAALAVVGGLICWWVFRPGSEADKVAKAAALVPDQRDA